MRLHILIITFFFIIIILFAFFLFLLSHGGHPELHIPPFNNSVRERSGAGGSVQHSVYLREGTHGNLP